MLNVLVCRYYFNINMLKKHKLRKGDIPLKFCEPETSEPAVDPANIGVNTIFLIDIISFTNV